MRIDANVKGFIPVLVSDSLERGCPHPRAPRTAALSRGLWERYTRRSRAAAGEDTRPPLCVGLDFDPHRSHQGEGIRFLNDARTHLVVENHLVALDVILEVDVGRSRGERLYDVVKGQVMCADESDGSA